MTKEYICHFGNSIYIEVGIGNELKITKKVLKKLLEKEETTIDEIDENGGFASFLTYANIFKDFYIMHDNMSRNIYGEDYEKHYLCIVSLDDEPKKLIKEINKINDNKLLTRYYDIMEYLEQPKELKMIRCMYDHHKDPMKEYYEI